MGETIPLPDGQSGRAGRAWRIPEAAVEMNVSEALLRKQIKLGLIKVFRVGRSVRIADEEVARIMNRQPEQSPYLAELNVPLLLDFPR